MKTLFDHAREKIIREEQPLAARMRPRTLDEYVGQEHILAPGRLLRRAIQADQLSSLIFYGPPGTGKTTLASVIANTTKSQFVTLNAVMAGIADLRDITAAAQARLGEQGQRTILFVDEVHRWNKAQQDALLPWVENGTVILIGATTENPYFTVNRALVSRSRIFQLKPLDNENIKDIIRQAIKDPVRGFGAKKVQFDDDALDHLADVANGDARAALNALELAVETTPEDDEKVIHITMAVAEESIQKRAVLYDREGDCHFDTISAFIKSMRGSDPDATFYWLAKMVYAGEDPRFIFRRMTIFCSEDIGMADPKALPFVIAAAEAFDRVGLPEGHYPLAHAALYCATAPKSNSVMGFFDALKVVGSEREDEVPNHLRDASRDKEGFGHGVGYQYPHAYRDHWVAQQYLPDSLQGKIFYEPGTIGYEATLADTVRDRRELQLAAIRENDARLAPPEILTFSPADKNTERWLARAADNLAPQLATIRERLFALHPVQRHDLVLDLTADAGAFLWEAVRKAPEGGVWGFVKNQQNADILLEQAQNLNSLRRPNLLVAKPETAFNAINQSEWKDVRFDVILGRNFLANAADKKTAVQNIVKLMNAREASVMLAENIARHTQRLAALIQDIGQEWLPRIRQAEDDIYANPDDPLVNWDEKTLAALFEDAGHLVKTIELQSFTREVIISSAQLQHWFDNAPGSFRSRLLKLCSADDVDAFFNAVRSNLLNHKVQWTTQVAFLHIAAK
ncbi:MAG: AAA family ATPase [Victivallales bacterium]|nr:AAA family ATPase [Victivallales bacterium]